jgi:hypothetical protein
MAEKFGFDFQQIEEFVFSTVPTSSGVHPAFCSMGTRNSFPKE